MANEARRFRRRKKEDIFVYGYKIDQATDVQPSYDKSEETFHIFGQDSPDNDVQHNFTNLQITLLDKYTNNALLDLMTNQDPDVVTPKQYKVEQLIPVTCWANVKDALNTRYVKSWIVTGWVPGMPLPSGNANDKANFQMAGHGDLARQFQGAWIMAKKVASGAAVGMGVVPFAVPGEQSLYALSVVAISDPVPRGTNFLSEELDVTAAMVSAAGVVAWSEINAQTALTNTTHAYVIFLQTGTGVYPSTGVTPDKIRA